MHTRASDGRLTAAGVAAAARAAGMAAVAVTDHDTVAGVAEAWQAGARLGVTVVAGVELSVQVAGRGVHLLGLGIRTGAPALMAHLQGMRAAREERMRLMLARLRGMGVEVPWWQVEREARGQPLSRPHLARAMVRLGLVGTVQEAFDRYLADEGEVAAPVGRLDLAQGTSLVHEAGGLAVLAHPGAPGRLAVPLPELLEAAQAAGVDGIEVFHPAHDAPMRRTLLAEAAARGWVVTGGSDFHGDAPSRPVGSGKVPGWVAHQPKLAAVLASARTCNR